MKQQLLDDISWEEKHRPMTLDEIVGQDEIVNQLRSKLPKIPNLILKGNCGTGKTTAARVIINEMKADFHWINGSDTNGVNILRKRKDGGDGILEDFLRHDSVIVDGKKCKKIVVIDEADGLSEEAQKLLRGKMGQYPHRLFILTLNYEDKIIEPLKSRFKEYRFRPIDDKDIAKRLRQIATKENLNVTGDQLNLVSERARGDLRKAINDLQAGDIPTQTTGSDELFSFTKV